MKAARERWRDFTSLLVTVCSFAEKKSTPALHPLALEASQEASCSFVIKHLPNSGMVGKFVSPYVLGFSVICRLRTIIMILLSYPFSVIWEFRKDLAGLFQLKLLTGL